MLSPSSNDEEDLKGGVTNTPGDIRRIGVACILDFERVEADIDFRPTSPRRW